MARLVLHTPVPVEVVHDDRGLADLVQNIKEGIVAGCPGIWSHGDDSGDRMLWIPFTVSFEAFFDGPFPQWLQSPTPWV